MKFLKPLLKWSLVPLSILLVGGGVSAWQFTSWWNWANAAPIKASPNPSEKPPINLKIAEGTSAQQIGRELEALGVIRSATAWNLLARWLMLKEPQGGFKAGTYQLSPNESMEQIARKIWLGEVVQLTYTIPEGWSVKRMAAYFEERGFFSAKEFLAAVDQVSAKDFPWLPPSTAPTGFPKLEGYLYPDTYQFSIGSITPDEVVRTMLKRFEQVALPVYQQQQNKTTLSLSEWVTLSSIVEKEAVIPAERSRIAGVFANRLRKGIPLGADPTVEYGLGIQQTPDRPLTFDEVKTPSPYNTYVISGLPPAPIASPGIASLKAALSPENTDYLYFVARYDGTHVFSRTLEEHQAAQDSIHDQRETAQKANSQKPAKKSGSNSSDGAGDRPPN